jgi:hypothetical protein
MESIFNAADVQLIIDRINRIVPQTKPLWGKMNAGQMFAHLIEPTRVMIGDTKLKRGLIGYLFGGIAKKQFLSGKPFKQNLPTAPTFTIKEDRNFDEEKSKLIDILQRVQKGGPGAVTKDTHPFFGKMSPEEWDKLTLKHVDHHLRQFGV